MWGLTLMQWVTHIYRVLSDMRKRAAQMHAKHGDKAAQLMGTAGTVRPARAGTADRAAEAPRRVASSTDLKARSPSVQHEQPPFIATKRSSTSGFKLGTQRRSRAGSGVDEVVQNPLFAVRSRSSAAAAATDGDDAVVLNPLFAARSRTLPAISEVGPADAQRAAEVASEEGAAALVAGCSVAAAPDAESGAPMSARESGSGDTPPDPAPPKSARELGRRIKHLSDKRLPALPPPPPPTEAGVAADVPIDLPPPPPSRADQ